MKEMPPCPLCGYPTTVHCLRSYGGACDWWECLACDVKGVGDHSMPRGSGRTK